MASSPHAAAAISSLSKAQRNEAFWLCQQGISAYRAQNYPAARDFYTKALMLDPGDSILLSNRADTYHKCKNFESALADAKAATAADPEGVRGWYWLGLLRHELGDPKGSMEAFQTCIKREGFTGGGGDKKLFHEDAKRRIAMLEAKQDNEVSGRDIGGRGVVEGLELRPNRGE
jgi:predicted Zn-dependent protease